MRPDPRKEAARRLAWAVGRSLYLDAAPTRPSTTGLAVAVALLVLAAVAAAAITFGAHW